MGFDWESSGRIWERGVFSLGSPFGVVFDGEHDRSEQGARGKNSHLPNLARQVLEEICSFPHRSMKGRDRNRVQSWSISKQVTALDQEHPQPNPSPIPPAPLPGGPMSQC